MGGDSSVRMAPYWPGRETIADGVTNYSGLTYHRCTKSHCGAGTEATFQGAVSRDAGMQCERGVGRPETPSPLSPLDPPMVPYSLLQRGRAGAALLAVCQLTRAVSGGGCSVAGDGPAAPPASHRSVADARRPATGYG